MRRITLLVAMVAGVLVLASGVALAANIVGNNNPNLLNGTQQSDNIAGAAGNDTINALGGNDRAFGDSGYMVATAPTSSTPPTARVPTCFMAVLASTRALGMWGIQSSTAMR
jgi:Ca2+-binding RTX toxin-like protein